MIGSAPPLAGAGGRADGRGVMLVSARADAALRDEVAAGLRPMPEYLVLHRDHGLSLLDWGRLRPEPRARTVTSSLRHAAAGWKALDTTAVLSDGEHLGLPIAAARALRPQAATHVVIGHHLTTTAKRRLLALPGLSRGIDRVVVHSSHQRDLLVDGTPLDDDSVVLVRYGVDTAFWSAPSTASMQSQLVVSAGREHRDYRTLAQAVSRLDVDVFVAGGSTHSPSSTSRLPAPWPSTIARQTVGPVSLRERYADATVVVVPLVETDFPAGITVVLEAMSMGKAVVVSETAGMRGAVADPDAVCWVPPGDASALRHELQGLLGDESGRAALGQRARAAAERQHDVHRFAAEVAACLRAPLGVSV